MGILCFGAVGIGPGIPDFLMFSQVRGLSFLIRLAAAAACRRHDCATLKRKVRTKTDNGCGARFEGFRARLARGAPRLRPPGSNTRRRFASDRGEQRPGHRHQRSDHDTLGSANWSRRQGSPQMLRLYGASARSARARRTYNFIMDGAP